MFPPDSPLERYAVEGPEVLGERDLLALILGFPGAEGVVSALLHRFGGPDGLAHVPVHALTQVPGVGLSDAVRVHAACQLARHRRRPTPRYARSPKEAADILGPALDGLPHEEARALFLDRRCRVLGAQRLSAGSDRHTIIEPRHVLRPAVAIGAAALVVGHNHPSGDPTPSDDDILVTRRLAVSADVLGIQVADHLVFGEGVYTSMAELGVLPSWSEHGEAMME